MEKFLRNAPTAAVMIALIIQVDRVQAFGVRIGAGWLAVVFALFLAGTIFVLSYWNGRSKYEVTADSEKERARYSQQVRLKRILDNVHLTTWRWLVGFLLIDGALNLSETMANLPAGVTFWERGGALVYGIFPTLAAFGLGSLQAMIDRVPAGPTQKVGIVRAFDAWMRRIADDLETDAAHGASSATHDANGGRRSATHSAAYPKACPHGCGAMLASPQAFTAHVGRWCPKVRIPASSVPPFDKVSVDQEVEK